MKQRLQALYSALSGWFCWHAWNYARRREIARRPWIPHEAQYSDSDMTPDQRRILANEARQVLENRHYLAAFARVHAALESQAHGCDPDNRDKAQRVVIAKQLLHALRREITRQMEDGYMAEVELQEIERKRRILRFQR